MNKNIEYLLKQELANISEYSLKARDPEILCILTKQMMAILKALDRIQSSAAFLSDHQSSEVPLYGNSPVKHAEKHTLDSFVRATFPKIK